MSFRPKYRLATTPSAFADAAEALSNGIGPFAVDTERASSFRYDDRAFLVQIRRKGAGTFLIAPEGQREAVTAHLAPVLNGGEWIIHAAGEDLRSLAMLDLHPGTLFDTELASRLAGYTRPNLAAMVERFVGVELEKGHGHEDWSRTPLPPSWQDYAALDVEYLCELAEALAEVLDSEGKLDFAFQEFNYLITRYSLTPKTEKTWRDVKGLAAIRSRSGAAVARALWQAREDLSKERDVAPTRLLPNRVLIDIARAEPTTPAALSHAAGRSAIPPKETRNWLSVVEEALAADPSTWPARREPSPCSTPPKSSWERNYPQSWLILQGCREGIAECASELNIQPEILLAPPLLRDVIWHAPDSGTWDTHQAAAALTEAGARPWQVGVTAPILAASHARATKAGVPRC